MNRAILLGAVGALSAAVASGAHATALRTPFEPSDGLLAADASAAPLQGGGKGHGGGGGQHAGAHQGGGGGKHGGAARQGGGGGRHQGAVRQGGGGGRGQTHGGGGHARRTETHASGRGRGSGGGERTVRSSRSTRTERTARGTGGESGSTRLVRRGAAGTAGARGSERAARLLTSAAALGHGRGLASDAVNVRTENGRVRLLNRRGDILMDMDADRYGDIGAWRLRRMGDQRPRGNAPAFCRSGEGHPVWGREWCLDKGFGLGSRAGTLWSRGTIGDVVFLRQDYYPARLDRGGLLGVLGDLVLGRLALQAVTLGYDQPLVGTWVAEPRSPRLLRVYSGDYPVAEFVDTDYDNRPEILYVVQPLYF
ncbi:MAG: hypothetical protein ACJ8GN_13325 [Longimicrobiaceae bacterium]